MQIFLTTLMILTAYLVGSIPFGVVIGKIRGKDIRKYGSHNIGATNALRTLGKKWGAIVFLLDLIKGGIFVVLATYVFNKHTNIFYPVHPLIYGGAAVIGHLFPIYIKFKGGKGVSSIAGAVLAYSWPVAILGIIGFIISVVITKYVSLSSTIAGLCLLFGWAIFNNNDLYFLIFLIILVSIAIIKHIPNYKRLIKHEENKLSFKKNKKES